MTLGALIAAAGAVIAGALAGRLAGQYRARRRGHALAWTMALGLYAAGMVVLAVGLVAGWHPVTFGVYWGAGALLNVALLAVGQLLLLDPARAPLWWTLGGLAAVWTVGALTLSPPDPGALAAASAQASIPAGEAVFGSQALAWTILRPITLTSFVVVLVGSAWSGVRHRRLGVGLIAVGVAVAASSSAFLRADLDVGVPAALTVGVAIMYAGFRSASKAPRPARRDAEADAEADAAAGAEPGADAEAGTEPGTAAGAESDAETGEAGGTSTDAPAST